MDLNKSFQFHLFMFKKIRPMLGNKCMSTSQPHHQQSSQSHLFTPKTTPMLGKKITPTFQPTTERSIQSHTNPHHPMHGEQINKLMDDWIDMFKPPHIA